MDRDIPALQPDMEILAAVHFLLENRVTGAPVVDENRSIIGILTEKDCLRLLAEGADNQPPKGTVREFMTTNVKTVPPTMNIYFVAGMFLNDVVRRFPVVEDGKFIGVITRLDILRAIESNF
jgi:CBS domain-containing protein